MAAKRARSALIVVPVINLTLSEITKVTFFANECVSCWTTPDQTAVQRIHIRAGLIETMSAIARLSEL